MLHPSPFGGQNSSRTSKNDVFFSLKIRLKMHGEQIAQMAAQRRQTAPKMTSQSHFLSVFGAFTETALPLKREPHFQGFRPSKTVWKIDAKTTSKKQGFRAPKCGSQGSQGTPKGHPKPPQRRTSSKKRVLF